MIESLLLPQLLAQLSPPPNIRYNNDLNNTCPGFTSEDNRQISLAAVNYLNQIKPDIKNTGGNIRILFTNQFLTFRTTYSPGDFDAEEQRFIRFSNFVWLRTPGEERFIFFCPHPDLSDNNERCAEGFSCYMTSLIEDFYLLARDSLLGSGAVFKFFGIERVKPYFDLKGGSLFYVFGSNPPEDY